MKFLTYFALGTLSIFVSQTAMAVDYWPMTESSVYHYVNDDGATLVVTVNGEVRNGVYDYWGTTCWSAEGYRADADGDLLLVANSEYCQGAIDPSEWSYEPSVKFIDLPLEVGKSWIAPTSPNGGNDPSSFFFISVPSQETVTVPYGTFDVMVLQVVSPNGEFDGVFYLNRELGPVLLPGGFRLADISDPVRIQGESWGTVKALFR